MTTAGNPLVIAHHLIWTVYGWWLPNDPRGSGSHTIDSAVLADLGEIHYGRKKVQPVGDMVRKFYAQAEDKLNHSLRVLTPTDIALVAAACEEVMTQRRYTCYACAIRPDHVHVLIRKHRDSAEMMLEEIKTLSRKRLEDAGWSGHPVWAGGGGWKVFLDHPQEVQRIIGYIQRNPLKAHLFAQNWPFVVTYNNWPLHPGHSPNSPYVRALQAAGRYP